MENNMEAERLSVFIESMISPNPPFLQELEQEALAQRVPIIRPQTQSLIKFLMETLAPKRILEVGTAVGFSALLMRSCAPEGCRITTIEKMDARADEALENFRRAQIETGSGAGQIELLRGDAAEILAGLPTPAQEGEAFDFVFLDAAKGQYIRYLPELKRLMRPGSVMLSDNILKDGEILESKFAVTRRNRTIHKRMHEFLQAITTDTDFRTVIMETGDGAAMSVLRRK